MGVSRANILYTELPPGMRSELSGYTGTSNNWIQSLNQEFNGGQAFNIISVNIENDLKELNDKKSNSLEVF